MLHVLTLFVVFVSPSEAACGSPVAAWHAQAPQPQRQGDERTEPLPPRPGATPKAQSVPEPAALLLVGSGLVGLALTRRRRRTLGP